MEVKLNNWLIDDAAKNLVKLSKRVDARKQGAPSFLLVLTATSSAYVRADGVIVAPLAALAP